MLMPGLTQRSDIIGLWWSPDSVILSPDRAVRVENHGAKASWKSKVGHIQSWVARLSLSVCSLQEAGECNPLNDLPNVFLPAQNPCSDQMLLKSISMIHK